MRDAPERLPVETLRQPFGAAIEAGPVVVSSPTGSGKSTQVPRWCPGRVLVVEPRRVACRSLAQRVAELEGTPLGEGVGYRVRDESRAGAATRLLFATPGVVLRAFERLEAFDTVVVDEVHERRLDVDLLLALLAHRFRGRLVVMSATLEGDRVASHLGGRHLHAEGRLFPVGVRYLPQGTLLPASRGLAARVGKALLESRGAPGDVLVFLPGKGEIADCAAALRGLGDIEVLELHGGLTLEEQSRVFRPSARRKVILATNVAETSVTIPGVGVVIDSGLVRQTRYHRGRGFLTLVPVALDSAEQRAGRAGRTAPGVCFRLWGEAAQLEPRTPPEVHREALAPLVLAAAAWGEAAEELPFLDPPKEHALAAAREELGALGALDEAGRLTPRGRQLFGLPLDAPLGRLLVEAAAVEEGSPGVLADMIDLVSVLSVGRRPFVGKAGKGGEGREEPAEADGSSAARCDATAFIRALRRRPEVGARDRRDPFTLREARAVRRRLRRAFGLPEGEPEEGPVDRRRLAMTVLAADPRVAHVARRRGRRVAWSNGGTEIELARESLAAGAPGVEAVAVLDSRALGLALGGGGRGARVLGTCAMPLELAWLVEAGLGRRRVAAATLDGGRVVARVERVFARKVLAVSEEVPRGPHARRAVARLFLAGRIFPQALEVARERLEAAGLALALAERGLEARGFAEWSAVRELWPRGAPELEAWVEERLGELGLDSGEDLALLSAADLLPPDLPPLVREALDREFPRTLEIPDAVYEVTYDLARREVLLEKVRGMRKEVPSLTYLPRFPGFRIKVRQRADLLRVLRE